MELERDGREFARMTWENLPEAATVEVQFGGTGSWFPTTGTGQTRQILVAGPDVTQGSALYVVTASCTVRARITDNPEIVPRPAGIITLKSA